MRSFLAALRTLHLPYGKKSGSRITLDGVNGTITVYNDSDDKIVVLDEDGFRALGANFPGTKIEIDPHNVELNFYDSGSPDPVKFSAYQHTEGTGLNIQTAENSNGEYSDISMVPGNISAAVLRRVDTSIDVLEEIQLTTTETKASKRLNHYDTIPIPRMASGSENITPTDEINPPWGTLGDAYRGIASVSFPSGRFSTAPRVVAMVASEFAVHYSAGAKNITSTGFDLVFDSSGTTARDVHWIAVEEV